MLYILVVSSKKYFRYRFIGTALYKLQADFFTIWQFRGRYRVMYLVKIILTAVSKSKAIPLQIWTGPEDSSRLRLPDFKTVGT